MHEARNYTNSGEDSTFKVVLYSHDSQGIGHVRRNLAIAHHIAHEVPARTGRKVSGLIVSGLAHATVFPLPEGFDWLFIPSITKGSEGYEPRHLGEEMPYVLNLRSKVLQATLNSFRPDLVVVDRHIYGVGQELKKPLRKLRKKHPQTQIVLGLREVLDAPEAVAAEWNALQPWEELDSLVDAVWVYGDEGVHNPVSTGEIPAFLADKVTFTGFLSHGRNLSDADAAHGVERPFVLTCAGGGSDGYELLQAAVRMDVPEGHRHIVIAGPQMSEEHFQSLAKTAGQSTEVYRVWPGLSELITRAQAVISMGGYNTVAEILASDTPALIVPREHPRTEQLIRARALHRVDALDYLRLDSLCAEALGTWAHDAVSRRVNRCHIDRDGLSVLVEQAVKLASPLASHGRDETDLEKEVEEWLSHSSQYSASGMSGVK